MASHLCHRLLASSGGASQPPAASWPLALLPVAALLSLRQNLPRGAEVVDHGNHVGAPRISDCISIRKKRERPCGSCRMAHTPVPRRLVAALLSLRQVLPRRGEVVDHGNQLGAKSIEDSITITKTREKPSGSCQLAHAPAPRRPRCTILIRVVLIRNPKAGPPNASGSRLH